MGSKAQTQKRTVAGDQGAKDMTQNIKSGFYDQAIPNIVTAIRAAYELVAAPSERLSRDECPKRPTMAFPSGHRTPHLAKAPNLLVLEYECSRHIACD